MVQGLNKEYTADNSRFMDEFGDAFEITSIDEGIEKQIIHEKRMLKWKEELQI